VGEVNLEMARAWDGPEGERWAKHATGYDNASARQWRRFLELVPIREADRILDIGCGSGRSTCDMARLAPAGSATGVDLSTAMLRVARSRAAHEGLTNVGFERADAQVHPFDRAAVDLVVSVFARCSATIPWWRSDVSAALWHPMADWPCSSDATWRATSGCPRSVRCWLSAASSRSHRETHRGRSRSQIATGFGRSSNRPAFGTFSSRRSTSRPTSVPTSTRRTHSSATSGSTHGLLNDLDGPTSQRALANLKEALSRRTTPDGVLLGASSWLVTASA
jgi:hypothetical protein